MCPFLCFCVDQLALDEGCRRLVSRDIWRRLRTYFPAAPEYRVDAEVCSRCRVSIEVQAQLSHKTLFVKT